MGGISTSNHQSIKINQQPTLKQNNQSPTKPLASSHVKTIDQNKNKYKISNTNINPNTNKLTKPQNTQILKNQPTSNISTPNKQNAKNLQKVYKRNQSAVQLHPASKLKFLENNKKFLQQSIETTICVERMLNLLCHREILANNEYNSLIAQNIRSLESKQRKYRNLQAKEHRIKLMNQQALKQPNRNNNKSKQTSSLYDSRETSKRTLPTVSKYHNKSRFALKKI